MDIAIFGGSFDPFHIGHEKIVNLALEKLDITKLFIIPTFLNPFKQSSFLDATTRLKLIEELYASNTNINVLDYEVKQNKKVSTYETLLHLQTNHKLDTIYLIIGADNLKNIHLWYNFDYIKDNVQFVVINRNNHHLNSKYIKAIYLNLSENISSSQLREKMDLSYIPHKIQKKVKKLWKQE
jgi:nicotinate-nucleotide adenylyltransferase